jgi:hypothetical protein
MNPAGLAKVLLATMLSSVAAAAAAQIPQISEGVRVMMSVGKGKFGPEENRYMLIRQPPLYTYLPPETILFFNAESEVIAFFAQLPATLKSQGLWITRGGPVEMETAEDRQHLIQLVREARLKGLSLYVCEGELSGDSPLLAWACQIESPGSSRKGVLCAPREKPHLGHPWWDCASRESK